MTKMSKKHRENSPLEEFKEVFHGDHREIRDTLLKLNDAFKNKNKQRAASLIKKLPLLCSPHFRYEEEALHPALEKICGRAFIENMNYEHDKEIIMALQLEILLARPGLTATDARTGQRLVHSMMHHIIECDGLSIMAELLPESTIKDILDTRKKARNENLPLLEWIVSARKHSLRPTFERELYATLKVART